jgi:hypothetical protein
MMDFLWRLFTAIVGLMWLALVVMWLNAYA